MKLVDHLKHVSVRMNPGLVSWWHAQTQWTNWQSCRLAFSYKAMARVNSHSPSHSRGVVMTFSKNAWFRWNSTKILLVPNHYFESISCLFHPSIPRSRRNSDEQWLCSQQCEAFPAKYLQCHWNKNGPRGNHIRADKNSTIGRLTRITTLLKTGNQILTWV